MPRGGGLNSDRTRQESTYVYFSSGKSSYIYSFLCSFYNQMWCWGFKSTIYTSFQRKSELYLKFSMQLKICRGGGAKKFRLYPPRIYTICVFSNGKASISTVFYAVKNRMQGGGVKNFDLTRQGSIQYVYFLTEKRVISIVFYAV